MTHVCLCAHPLLATTAAWRATYRVTVRWSKRQNLAIAVDAKATSRVIAPNLRILPVSEVEVEVEVEAPVQVARSAIAAVKLATLRVHAPRHPEVVQEVMAVVEGEAMAALVAVVAVKRHVTRAEG